MMTRDESEYLDAFKAADEWLYNWLRDDGSDGLAGSPQTARDSLAEMLLAFREGSHYQGDGLRYGDRHGVFLGCRKVANLRQP
jgi:hypothetical protein